MLYPVCNVVLLNMHTCTWHVCIVFFLCPKSNGNQTSQNVLRSATYFLIHYVKNNKIEQPVVFLCGWNVCLVLSFEYASWCGHHKTLSLVRQSWDFKLFFFSREPSFCKRRLLSPQHTLSYQAILRFQIILFSREPLFCKCRLLERLVAPVWSPPLHLPLLFGWV